MNTFQITLVVLAGLLLIYHFLLRPRILTRGATKHEASRKIPGDELIPANPFRSTMATDINASPENIWPWLVQVGWGKAAFYSYNIFESLLGMDLHNADQIHPEWQDVSVGDTIWMSHPRQKALFPLTRVEEIKPPHELVFALYRAEDPDTKPSGAWSFILEPLDDKKTRLLTRLQVVSPTTKGKFMVYFFLEPAHFIMQQGMFKGLKKRLAAPELEHTDQVHA